jgi:uncharacterized protein (TIGR01777 family)
MLDQSNSDRNALRIAVSGATGLVGSHLCASLAAAGHRVDRLVRRAPAPDTTDIAWDPAKGSIDADALDGTDAVVHLAGESIADGRWTAEKKRRIRDSRVQGTTLLCRTLAALANKPRVLVAASAVGYYGDRGDELVTEASPAGRGFLPEVCRDWEAACQPARDAGIRVVNVRLGVVLTPKGGALAKMLGPFKAGLGGRVGAGRQYMSWIALDDLIGAIHFVLAADRIAGPVNATAPNPVTNAEFARTLGRVLRRPAVIPAPAAMIKLAFGEMGRALLLEGARVLPHVLQQAGFEFHHPQLEPALRALLGSRE